MMIRMMSAITPMIIIIFIFCHQYFLFSFVACEKCKLIS